MERRTLHDIYKARRDRSLDLHLLGEMSNGTKITADRLTRAQPRPFRERCCRRSLLRIFLCSRPLHLFKHMCSEHTRAFWVLEFWRHVITRRDDVAFWRSVRLIAASEPQAEIAIGAATMLASLIFGPFAPCRTDFLVHGSAFARNLSVDTTLRSSHPAFRLTSQQALFAAAGTIGFRSERCESSAKEVDLPNSSAATRHARGIGRINLFPSQSLSRAGEVRAYQALVPPRRRVTICN